MFLKVGWFLVTWEDKFANTGEFPKENDCIPGPETRQDSEGKVEETSCNRCPSPWPVPFAQPGACPLPVLLLNSPHSSLGSKVSSLRIDTFAHLPFSPHFYRISFS